MPLLTRRLLYLFTLHTALAHPTYTHFSQHYPYPLAQHAFCAAACWPRYHPHVCRMLIWLLHHHPLHPFLHLILAAAVLGTHSVIAFAVVTHGMVVQRGDRRQCRGLAMGLQEFNSADSANGP